MYKSTSEFLLENLFTLAIFVVREIILHAVIRNIIRIIYASLSFMFGAGMNATYTDHLDKC